jgi:hypothetical protein
LVVTSKASLTYVSTVVTPPAPAAENLGLSLRQPYREQTCGGMLVPPSAPERTMQASGQSQASAHPKGGPPRCSVPVSSTRWAASGTSPLMKPSCVGMCKDKPTHVQLCNPMRSRENKSRNMPAAGARNINSFAKEAQTISLTPGPRQQLGQPCRVQRPHRRCALVIRHLKYGYLCIFLIWLSWEGATHRAARTSPTTRDR